MKHLEVGFIEPLLAPKLKCCKARGNYVSILVTLCTHNFSFSSYRWEEFLFRNFRVFRCKWWDFEDLLIDLHEASDKVVLNNGVLWCNYIFVSF